MRWHVVTFDMRLEKQQKLLREVVWSCTSFIEALDSEYFVCKSRGDPITHVLFVLVLGTPGYDSSIPDLIVNFVHVFGLRLEPVEFETYLGRARSRSGCGVALPREFELLQNVQ